MARADVAAYGAGHETDGARTGDEHVLAHHVERQRTVHGVAEGIEYRGDVGGDVVEHGPEIRGRHLEVFGDGAVAPATDADRTVTEMAFARAAIAADAAGDMAFARDAIAHFVTDDAGTDLDDEAHEFVADDARHMDVALRPVIPVHDVEVSAADAGLADADLYLVGADGRAGRVFHPEARLGAAFDEGFHRRGSRMSCLESNTHTQKNTPPTPRRGCITLCTSMHRRQPSRTHHLHASPLRHRTPSLRTARTVAVPAAVSQAARRSASTAQPRFRHDIAGAARVSRPHRCRLRSGREGRWFPRRARSLRALPRAVRSRRLLGARCRGALLHRDLGRRARDHGPAQRGVRARAKTITTILGDPSDRCVAVSPHRR